MTKTNSNELSSSSTPINARAIANKVLVAVLCALSFAAGFYAQQSRQINYCKAQNLTATTIEQSVVICQAQP